MDPSDSSQNRRKIPAVSDVVAELSKRLLATPEQQPVLFRAAQQVCAEELRLVRTGFRSAPFDELVERAIRLLPAEMAREESLQASENTAFPEPEPFDTIAAPARPGRAAEEGPFALDSRDAVESYEPPRPPPKPDSGPVRPLEISETTPPSAPPASPYRGYLREPGKDRRSRSTSATRVVIFLVLVGLGFGAYRLARSGYWPFRKAVSSAPKKAPAGAPAAAPSKAAGSSPGAPLVSEPSPSPAQTVQPPRLPSTASAAPNPTAAPSPSRATSSPAPAPGAATAGIPESRGSSMISADWDGHAPAYMIHFSSYQRRENAERDQARLSKEVGRPFRVIEVNLGREGPWFRVMLGEFSSRDEALAFRQQLADKGTPGMGLVYKVSGTR